MLHLQTQQALPHTVLYTIQLQHSCTAIQGLMMGIYHWIEYAVMQIPQVPGSSFLVGILLSQTLHICFGDNFLIICMYILFDAQAHIA
jgi:hypothetical protein